MGIQPDWYPYAKAALLTQTHPREWLNGELYWLERILLAHEAEEGARRVRKESVK